MRPAAAMTSGIAGAAWMVKIKLTNPAELDKLMDGAAYEAYVAAKGKEASA